MLEEKDMQKLEKLREEASKDKIESKVDVDIENLIRNVMAKEFDTLEMRLYSGLREAVYSSRNTIMNDIRQYQDEKFQEIKRMLQDKGFEAEDPKQKEIIEYIDKLKMLIGEKDGR